MCSLLDSIVASSPVLIVCRACGIAFREGLNTLCCSPSLAVDHVQSTIKECAKTIHQTFFSHVGPDEEETLIKTIADAERVVSQADSLLTKVCIDSSVAMNKS